MDQVPLFFYHPLGTECGSSLETDLKESVYISHALLQYSFSKSGATLEKI